MTNMGGLNAGSITAALFLEEFVDGHPWAHVDIAGTAQLPAPRTWRNKGATRLRDEAPHRAGDLLPAAGRGGRVVSADTAPPDEETPAGP